MYIYMLRCSDNSLYTGIAIDIVKRIKQHLGILSGGAKYTRSHPVKYIEAIWSTESDSSARKLEYKLKKAHRKIKDEIIDDPINMLAKLNIGDSEFTVVNIDTKEYNKLFNFK